MGVKLIVCSLVAALAVAASVQAESKLAKSLPYYKSIAPTDWTDQQWETALSEDIIGACAAFRQRFWQSPPGTFYDYSSADRSVVAVRMSKSGMNLIDRQMARNKDGKFASGQTFRGFMCSTGIRPDVNKSFYQGVGHKWQAVLPGSMFVYFEGDGTETGMVLTGWN